MQPTSSPALLSFAAIFALCACEPTSPAPPAPTQTAQAPVVYGEDDRLDYYAHPNAELRRLTREAIVAHMSPGDLNAANPNDIQPQGQTYGPAYGLCQGEPFYDQPAVAGCSGTLIDDDLVLTAGHCVTAQQCPQVRYVFDFYYRAQGDLETIQTQDVYSCVQVLARAQQGDDDYAVVKLDRPVTGRAPAPVRRSRGRLAQAQDVWIIGFGNGLPAKLDEGGQVNDPGRADGASQFFATVDAFGGNSGSGVFDTSGQVVGILVAGRTDYAASPEGCQIVNRVDDLNGENVVYAHRALDALCATGYPSERLCPENLGGWCSACATLEDCQEGWACRPPAEGFSQSRCAPLCARDQDCREDHRCEQGFCAPRIIQTCQGDTPARQDACLESDLGQPCAGDQACVNGACQARPEGDTCASPLVIEPVTQTLTGDLSQGFAADLQGSCAGAGPELVYQFDVARQGRLQALADGFDTVLYLRADNCQAGREVACNDDIQQGGDLRSRLDVALTPGRHFLFMDTFDSAPSTYNLALTFNFDEECQDACPREGAARCGAQGREVCAASPEGCLAWASDPCAPGLSCTDAGQCAACDCDEPGATRCRGAAQLESCTEITDGCAAWTPSQTCGDGEVCEAGACVFTCQDACPQEGLQACEGSTARACARNVEGCLSWVTLDTCGPREVCEAGACLPTCQDACPSLNARRCGDDNEVEACRVGAGGCLAWISAQSCAPDEACVGQGTCAPACQDACPRQGQTRCADGGVQTCALAQEGCLAWEASRPCGADQACQGGACVEVCQDACALEGSTRCADLGSLQRCERAQTGCLAWSAPLTCADGEACLSGACSATCQDACEPGALTCEGDQVWRCDAAPNGCAQWFLSEECAQGQRCEAGACVGACEDACGSLGQTRCTEQEAVEVCDTNDAGCLAWFVALQCADDERCQDGLCLPQDIPDAGTDLEEDPTEDATEDTSNDTPEDITEDTPDPDAQPDAPAMDARVETQQRTVRSGALCHVAPSAGPRPSAWWLLLGLAALARRR
jgi:V8-like Glu-specific endopeptidase